MIKTYYTTATAKWCLKSMLQQRRNSQNFVVNVSIALYTKKNSHFLWYFFIFYQSLELALTDLVIWQREDRGVVTL
jgi:hypothetical protein